MGDSGRATAFLRLIGKLMTSSYVHWPLEFVLLWIVSSSHFPLGCLSALYLLKLLQSLWSFHLAPLHQSPCISSDHQELKKVLDLICTHITAQPRGGKELAGDGRMGTIRARLIPESWMHIYRETHTAPLMSFCFTEEHSVWSWKRLASGILYKRWTGTQDATL